MITLLAAAALIVTVVGVVTTEALRRSPLRVILLRLATILLALPGGLLLLVAILAWQAATVRTAAMLTGVSGAMIAASLVTDRLTRRERTRSGAGWGFDVAPPRRRAGEGES